MASFVFPSMEPGELKKIAYFLAVLWAHDPPSCRLKEAQTKEVASIRASRQRWSE